MPYAPGIQARAGDYFALMGPRIAETIQNWQKNREEREQSTVTAEMLGRYLKDDPEGIEMFGEKLSQVPGMSAGQAKGVIGGVTTYLAQKHLKAAEQAQADATKLAHDQYQLLADREGRARAGEERLARFNQLINPPLMFTDAAGPRPQLTPEALTRYAAKAGVLGDAQVGSLIDNYARAQAKQGGLEIGKEFTSPSGAIYRGTGSGVQIQEPKEPPPAKGMPIGWTQETPDGVYIGKGEGSEVEFVKKPAGEKPSTLDEGFLMYTPVYAHQLDAAEDAVNKFGKGKAIGFWSSPEAVATFQQLPSLLANSFAKITDPSGTVRDSDREDFMKRLFPQGNMTRTETTIAALNNLRQDLATRVYSWGANQKEKGRIPGGMPGWVGERVKAIGGAPQGSAAGKPVATAVARRPILTPDGKVMDIRADQYDEALKHGYKPAP